MKQALIFYATREGQTEKVALALAQHLSGFGVDVATHNLKNNFDPAQLLEADLLVFGASMHAGGLEGELLDFINSNAAVIRSQHRAFFLVLLSAATTDAALRERSLTDARHKVGQQLDVDFEDIEYIAGALAYSKYSRPVRWIMQRIARQHGEDTNTSQDYEYTDWQQVISYADKLYNAHLAAS